jgi:hypothetical protein
MGVFTGSYSLSMSARFEKGQLLLTRGLCSALTTSSSPSGCSSSTSLSSSQNPVCQGFRCAVSSSRGSSGVMMTFVPLSRPLVRRKVVALTEAEGPDCGRCGREIVNVALSFRFFKFLLMASYCEVERSRDACLLNDKAHGARCTVSVCGQAR